MSLGLPLTTALEAEGFDFGDASKVMFARHWEGGGGQGYCITKA